MTTGDFLDHLLRNLDEVIFPALAAYAVYVLREFVRAWISRPK